MLSVRLPRNNQAQRHRESFGDQWNALSLHYATGIEHINGSLSRQPDPARLGGAVFVDLNRAVKDHPELLRRYLLTEAVTPGEDVFARAAFGVLDERFIALRAQGS